LTIKDFDFYSDDHVEFHLFGNLLYHDQFSGPNTEALFTTKFSEMENTCSALLTFNQHYFVSVEQILLSPTSPN
jgi:hypothetical protein